MRDRLRCAWNVLRGRPTGYRLLVRDGGFVASERGTLLVHCTVIGANVGVRVLPPGYSQPLAWARAEAEGPPPPA